MVCIGIIWIDKPSIICYNKLNWSNYMVHCLASRSMNPESVLWYNAFDKILLGVEKWS